MTKLKLVLLAAVATLSLTNPASSFAADARMTHTCTPKLRLLLCVLLLVWTAGSAGVLGSTKTLAQNAYITNEGSTTVSVIDTRTDEVTADIPVGLHTYGVAVAPDGGKIYVTDGLVANTGTVSVIDPETNKLLTTVAVGAQPKGLAVTPDGSRVYVADTSADTVSVIATRTNSVITTIQVGFYPNGVAVSPDGGRVYVTNAGSNSVAVISTITNKVIDTVAVQGLPSFLTVTPDGDRVMLATPIPIPYP